MQTFDVRPPAFRSPRNDQSNFSSNQPPQPDENFGDLMNRALAGNPRPSNREEAPERGRAESQPPRSLSKATAKKPDRPDTSGAATDASRTAALAADSAAASKCAPPDTQTAPDDDGTSEDASESGTDKGRHAAGKSADATTSATAIVPNLAGPLGVPSPSPTPVKAAGKEAKGNSKGGSGASTPAEAPGDAAAHSDSTKVEAKDSTDPAEKALTASDPPAKGSPESKLPSDKTVSATDLTSSADPAGTSAAKQYLTMNKTDKTPKIAGSAEQVLPGNAATGSEELPTAQKSSVSALLHGSEKLDSTVTIDSPATAPISPEPAAVTVTQAVLPAVEVESRLRVLERTHDIVALHAMRLSQSPSDSLHLVVKPGGGIQLSLELRQGEGFIEVNASLHKGDFAHLNQYWPELQQRLEARGVRVGELGRSENLTDTGHQEFQSPKQHQQSPDQDPLQAGAFAEFALAGSLRDAPATRAARATAYRGWESWA